MTQILVTLNEDVTTQHVRKAIELLYEIGKCILEAYDCFEA